MKHKVTIQSMDRTGKAGSYFSFVTATGTANGRPFKAIESGERGRTSVGGKTVWRVDGDFSLGERIAISKAIWKKYWQSF